MKSSPIEKSESLKKALKDSKTFDEAEYYKSRQVEMGGDNVLEETEEAEEPEEIEEDDDDVDYEDHEYYGDDE